MLKGIFKGLFFMVAAFLVTMSCKNQSPKVVLYENEQQPQLVVSFLQSISDTASSPDYIIRLYDNRQMHLEANQNIDKKGKFFRTLSEEEYDQVMSAFKHANLLKLNSEIVITDSSQISRKIIIEHEGKKIDVAICDSTPDEVVELEYTLKSFLDRVGWNQLKW